VSEIESTRVTFYVRSDHTHCIERERGREFEHILNFCNILNIFDRLPYIYLYLNAYSYINRLRNEDEKISSRSWLEKSTQ